MRNKSIKRKFDGSTISTRWNPPAENSVASSILVGCWAEGLEGVSPSVSNILDSALKTYLKRVIRNGVDQLRTEPRLPHIEQHANALP